MAEAVRKESTYRQYQTMLANEAGCRSGKSIDAVHDMRVATWWLRVALRLFGGYFKRGLVRDLETDLRKTGRTLGAARDLDVFNKTARLYLRSLPKAQRSDLDPLWPVGNGSGRWLIQSWWTISTAPATSVCWTSWAIS